MKTHCWMRMTIDCSKLTTKTKNSGSKIQSWTERKRNLMKWTVG
jgi:hypothetical protein